MYSFSWKDTQDQIAVWATHNFGENPPWQPMMGLIEEIGEFFAVEESFDSPEVTPDGLRSGLIDAIGDQFIYALNLATKVGIDFVDIPPNNPPNNLTTKRLLGVLAAGCQAILKNSQGIRKVTAQVLRERMRVCLSLWYQWATCQVLKYNLPSVHAITAATWSEVMKRDWAKFRDDAHEQVG